jgi:hypothetical protein
MCADLRRGEEKVSVGSFLKNTKVIFLNFNGGV